VAIAIGRRRRLLATDGDCDDDGRGLNFWSSQRIEAGG